MFKIILKANILKSLYYSLRFQFPILIGKNVSLKIETGAKILGHIGSRLTIGIDYYSERRTLLHIAESGVLEIKGSASLKKGAHISIQKSAKVKVGHQTFINEDSKILIYNECIIGDNTAISYDVLITDSDVHSYLGREASSNIIIGNNVWIGARALILKGVDIADNCIVAAGSTVKGTFPKDVLIAESSATIRRYGVFWKP